MKTFKYISILSIFLILFSCGGGSSGSSSGTSTGGGSSTATVTCTSGAVCLPSAVSIVQPSTN